MDGACTVQTSNCTITHPEYAYVESSDVVPYFQIAQQYGYANYMFQTNQGPSFPAHQFLLSGTSAPLHMASSPTRALICPATTPWEWFAAENAPRGAPYGCTAMHTVIPEINPGGSEHNGYNGGYPCYNHNSLVDLLYPNQPNNIGWKYYAAGTTPTTNLWTGQTRILKSVV